jgi:hypothetical protein
VESNSKCRNLSAAHRASASSATAPHPARSPGPRRLFDQGRDELLLGTRVERHVEQQDRHVAHRVSRAARLGRQAKQRRDRPRSIDQLRLDWASRLNRSVARSPFVVRRSSVVRMPARRSSQGPRERREPWHSRDRFEIGKLLGREVEHRPRGDRFRAGLRARMPALRMRRRRRAASSVG